MWNKGKRRPLTVPQQKTFVEHLNENKEFLGLKMVITILLGIGIRTGECLRLRWEEVIFKDSWCEPL